MKCRPLAYASIGLALHAPSIYNTNSHCIVVANDTAVKHKIYEFELAFDVN